MGDISTAPTYETPEFVWTGATGSFDPESGTGSVSFAGTVNFTGHDGVLDLTLGEPDDRVRGQGTAALLLDARSNDMEGEVAVDTEQEWVGDDRGRPGSRAAPDGERSPTKLRRR